MSFRTCLAFLVACAGCFSQPETAPDAGPKPDAATDAPKNVPDAAPDVVVATTETWSDGKQLTESVLIPSGVTVTIAPGAHVTASSGVLVWIQGTLSVASSAGAHALITGSGWTGLRVTDAGTLAADGLDLDGADTALDIEQQTSASYANGTITGSSTPMLVGDAGNLSIAHAIVTAPQGISQVTGALTASYLDYDAADHGVLFVDGATANVAIDDSTLHNSGIMGSKSAPDMITVNKATKLHVAYSDISGAHCGFHFEGITSLEIDHVTVHAVTNGADVWGTTQTGTRSVTSSNFESLSENFDETGSNGAVAVTGCYLTGTNKLTDAQIQITGSVSQPITDAKPR